MHVKSCRQGIFFFFLNVFCYFWLAKYFSSSTLPVWTWCSVYTCGANWRVWDSTIIRLYKEPTGKEIATTRQFRSIIAPIRSSEYYWGQKCHFFFLSKDEEMLRTRLIHIWVWYPWLYWAYILLTWEIFSKMIAIFMLQTCVLANASLPCLCLMQWQLFFLSDSSV